MKAIILIISLLLQAIIYFQEVITNLKTLETYIKEYKTIRRSRYSLTHLIVTYIREVKYKGVAWSYVGGNSPPHDLVTYI